MTTNIMDFFIKKYNLTKKNLRGHEFWKMKVRGDGKKSYVSVAFFDWRKFYVANQSNFEYHIVVHKFRNGNTHYHLNDGDDITNIIAEIDEIITGLYQ